MGKWLLVTILIAFGGVSARAEKLGGQGGSFLRLGLGADRVAMGDVGAALSGAGMNWYYNPAGLPYQTSRQASLGYRWLALDRSMLYAGYSTPLPGNAGLAIGFVRAATDHIDARDSNGRRFDLLSISDNLLHGTFALRPHPAVAIGSSLKWMISAVPDVLDNNKNLYAYGMGIDLGVQVRPLKRLRIGLQLRDINAKLGWDASDVWADGAGAKDDELPRLVRLGAAFDPWPELTLASDVVMNSSEIGKSSEDAISLRFGGEWRYDAGDGRALTLRGGWNGDAPTFGLGLPLRLRRGIIARMDYAYVLEKVAPSGSHLIGWTFARR